MPNPKREEMRVYVSQADAAKFHIRILTSSTMEREFNLQKRSVLAKLRAAKVETFAPDGQDFGALYLRKEVEAAMEPPRLHPESWYPTSAPVETWLIPPLQKRTPETAQGLNVSIQTS